MPADYDDEDDDLDLDASTPDEEHYEEIDLQQERVPVRIKGVDGVKRLYELRDIRGITRDRYMDKQLARARKKGPDGRRGGGASLVGYQSELIALCLWDLGKHVEVKKDADGEEVEEVVDTLGDDDVPIGQKRVPQKLVDSWPARVQQYLYPKCQKVAGIDTGKSDESEAEEKND